MRVYTRFIMPRGGEENETSRLLMGDSLKFEDKKTLQAVAVKEEDEAWLLRNPFCIQAVAQPLSSSCSHGCGRPCRRSA